MKTTRYALLASALFRIALTAPAPAGENVWTSHGPTDIGWITDVAISDSTVYAATLNGVFRSDDGGATWRQSALPGEPIDQVLARSGEAVVFAKSRLGALYVSRDQGQSWAPAGLPSVYTVALDSGHPSTVYAASADGRLAKSTDAGTSWLFPSRIPGDGNGIGFAFDSRAIYILTGSGLYKSVDGGTSWTIAPPPRDNVYVIAAGNSGSLYAIAANGFFCRSADGAATWTCSSFPAYTSYNIRIAELPGDGGRIGRIDDGRPRPVPRILAASSSGLLMSRDGGATWVETAKGLGLQDAEPHGLTSDGSIVLVGTDRRILRSSDRGDTWSASSAGLQSSWIHAIALDPQEASKVWAGAAGWGGRGPGLFRSTDAGNSWSPIDHAGLPSVSAIAIDPKRPSTVYAGQDEVFRTDDGGATWTSSNLSPGYVNSLVLDPDSPQSVWAATGKGLFKSEDGARRWRPASIAQSIYSVLFDQRRPDTMYAGSYFGVDFDYHYPYGGSLFVSRDRGETFTKSITNFGSQVIAIVQDPFHEGVLYAATYARVFRSADDGLTWQGEGTNLPQFIEALVADPVRPGRLYAGTAKGVYQTTDGGQTWFPFSAGLAHSSASSLAISPDGNRLHAGTQGGGVFELDLETEAPSYPCAASATRLCLVGNRYAVDLLAVRPGENDYDPGAARPLGDRAGYFGLPLATGDPDLPEVVVKMLPDEWFGTKGAPIFYSSLTTLSFVLTVTDTVTGRQSVYASDPDAPLCGGVDTAFAAAEAASRSLLSARAAAGETALRLLGGRFSVTLEARTAGTGRTARGTVMASGDRFGFFSLPELTGDPQFPEVVVKMIDARAINGTFWFFYTGLTSLDYTLTVTDSVTGAVRIYKSAASFCGGADVQAFTDSPPVTTALDLNGLWAGEISFPSDCFSACRSREQIEVTLSHVGNAVTGRFSTACLGSVELRVTLDGDRLSVDLSRVVGRGRFEGSATPENIRVEMNCDPWGYGDDHTMGIYLSRLRRGRGSLDGGAHWENFKGPVRIGSPRRTARSARPAGDPGSG